MHADTSNTERFALCLKRFPDNEIKQWMPKFGFKHKPFAELLIVRRADVNHRDSDGDTALSKACRVAKADMIGFLLEHNADPRIAGRNDQTPLDILLHREWMDNMEKQKMIVQLEREATNYS